MKKIVLTALVGLLAASLVGFAVGVQLVSEAWASEQCGVCEEDPCLQLWGYGSCSNKDVPCECPLGGGRTGHYYKVCPGRCSLDLDQCCDNCSGCSACYYQCREVS
jgi:hypothetical protein